MGRYLKNPFVASMALLVLVVFIAVATFGSWLMSGQEHPPTTTHIVADTSTTSPQSINNEAFDSTITIKDQAYRLAVETLKNILEEAKDIYLSALEENETWRILIYEPYSNLSKTLILNTTIVNETILFIGHMVYKYIVLHVYDSGSKMDFMPRESKLIAYLSSFCQRILR